MGVSLEAQQESPCTCHLGEVVWRTKAEADGRKALLKALEKEGYQAKVVKGGGGL